MANPSTMEGLKTALLEATTTAATIKLLPEYVYELTHSGVEDDDTAADVTISSVSGSPVFTCAAVRFAGGNR